MNLKALESATRYPSIERYHKIGEKGRLSEERNVTFDDTVILTEKVDGTNIRIIQMPDGDYFIGSRELLLHAKGDRVHHPFEGVVDYLKPVADRLRPLDDGKWVHVYYVEVYGGQIGAQSAQYTGHEKMGHRLFDIAFIPADALNWPVERIASWRDSGGQTFATEPVLQRFAEAEGMPLTPRLGRVNAEALPTDLATTYHWLRTALPCTQVALDGDAGAKAEGFVLRNPTRRTIAKVRFADYVRTLEPEQQKKRRR